MKMNDLKGVNVLVFTLFIIIIGIWSLTSLKNYDHNVFKNHVLSQIQDQINNRPTELSYQTDTHEHNSNYYDGEVYVINNVKDLKVARDILKHCKPLCNGSDYPTADTHILLDNICIGYSSTLKHFYWYSPDFSDEMFGFTLPPSYEEQLWGFLDRLPYFQ